MRNHRKSLCKNPAWCYVCGLPIPEDIVSNRHPLFATVDHIIPLAHGGKNRYSNRALVHQICNTKKGSKLVLTKSEIAELQSLVSARIKNLTRKQKRAANERVEVAIRAKAKKYRVTTWQLTTWENEGGALGCQ